MLFLCTITAAGPAMSVQVHIFGQLLERHGSREGIALQQVTLVAAQEVGLGLGFHPFGHHFQRQVVSHGNDAPGDGGITPVLDDFLDERVVDLDPVGRHLLDVGQARETGAEIINRDLYTQLPELVECVDHLAGVIDDRRLHHLQVQRLGWQAGFAQSPFDRRQKVGFPDLYRRDIHTYRTVPEAGGMEFDHIPASLVQHPLTQCNNLPGFLSQRYEVCRRYQAKLRVFPAHQRFHRAGLAGAGVDHRLVVEGQGMVVDGILQLVA